MFSPLAYNKRQPLLFLLELPLPLLMVWTRGTARRTFLSLIWVVAPLMSPSWPSTMAYLKWWPPMVTLTWEVKTSTSVSWSTSSSCTRRKLAKMCAKTTVLCRSCVVRLKRQRGGCPPSTRPALRSSPSLREKTSLRLWPVPSSKSWTW